MLLMRKILACLYLFERVVSLFSSKMDRFKVI